MSHHPLLNEHVLNLLPSKIDGLVILDVGLWLWRVGFLYSNEKGWSSIYDRGRYLAASFGKAVSIRDL